MAKYRHRICDELLSRKLAGVGAVLLEGPKWCGKTTTCEQIAKSVLYMGDKDTQSQNLQIADFKPSRLLEGAKPRLLDEWQIAPKLWISRVCSRRPLNVPLARSCCSLGKSTVTFSPSIDIFPWIPQIGHVTFVVPLKIRRF